MYDVRVELIHSMYNMSNIYKLGKFVVYLKRLRMKRWIKDDGKKERDRENERLWLASGPSE